MKEVHTKSISRKTFVLDEFDRNILGILSKNARIPLNRIAQILRASRQKVHYRYERLVEADILLGVKAIVNRRIFGLYKVHYFTNVKHADCVEMNAQFGYVGTYRYEVSYICNDLERIRSITSFDASAVECIITKVHVNTPFPYTFPDRFVYRNDSSFFQDFTAASEKPYSLDAIDMKLVKLLSFDASLDLQEYGDKIGLAYDATRERIRKLIRHGYIQGFVPIIDYTKIGYVLNCVLLKGGMSKTLFHHPQVLWAAEAQTHTIIYFLHFQTQDLVSFVSQLDHHYDILIRGKIIKYSYISDVLFEM